MFLEEKIFREKRHACISHAPPEPQKNQLQQHHKTTPPQLQQTKQNSGNLNYLFLFFTC